MDFPNDTRAQNIGEKFEFGKAFLVSPVTEPGALTKHLYLPDSLWYDFWTGAAVKGPTAIDTRAPLEELLLCAGGTCPLGPAVSYAMQDSNEPLEIRVYRGADGKFTLYEDKEEGYNYEKGSYSIIPFLWDEHSQSLRIGERTGVFPECIRKGHSISFLSDPVTESEIVRQKILIKSLVISVEVWKSNPEICRACPHQNDCSSSVRKSYANTNQATLSPSSF